MGSQLIRRFSIAGGLVAVMLANQQNVTAAQIFTDESAFKSSLSSFTTYNFDSFDSGSGFGQGTILDKQIPGLDFDNAVINLGAFGGTFRSPSNVILNQNTAGGNPIVINFLNPVFGVGLFNTSLVDRERFDIFDVNDNLLGSIELPESIVNFGGFITDVPIARAEIVGIYPTNGSIYIDDLTVVASSVPEPSSMLGLLAIGITGIGSIILGNKQSARRSR